MPRAARAPVAPSLPPELEAGEIKPLVGDDAYRETLLTDAVLTAQHAAGVRFKSTEWAQVDLSGSQLHRLELEDCRLRGCNLANVELRRAGLNRVTIDNSRLTGMGLTEALVRDVTIRGCRVDLASFGFSRLERVTFEDCLLGQTDFLDAQLDSVRFHGCDLTRADFRGARLRSCEFRRSDLTGLEGIQGLRGAAMEWPDIIEMAGVWAAALGIEVLDTD